VRHFNTLRLAAWALCLACVLGLGSCRRGSSGAASGGAAGEVVWLNANGLRLKTKVYQSTKLDQSPTLVIVLHGDSPFAPPSYQYTFARKLAEQNDNVVVAAVLRPGYMDDAHDSSDGTRGKANGDNYTWDVVDAIASVADQLKARYHPGSTVIIGHSGGAAIAADLLGRWPQEVDGALLVSCPCDVEGWRKHMLKQQDNPIWSTPVESISPITMVGDVPRTIHVRLLVGSEDNNTQPEFTQAYAAALKGRGGDVVVTVAPGLKHDILLEPVAFEQAKTLIQQSGRGK
jgi:pimeloyl-ACP methyl ester carboxylesterase